MDIRERIATYARKFSLEPIDLGSEASLPKGYVAGHAFGRTYSAKKIQTDIFYKDLELILAAYAALVDRGGTMPTDSMMEEAGTTDIEETRRYILSRRIERSKKVRRLVLERRGAICESCFFDPIKHTGFSGPIINAPLDVHHGKPIHHLAEGESRRYKIPEDFLVLCPTCHRMIHKLHNVADLELLRSKIRFVHAEKLPNLF